MSTNGIIELADCLKGGLGGDATPADVTKFLNSCYVAASDLKIDFWVDGGAMTDFQVAMSIRSIIIERIGKIHEVLKLGLSRGYLLPDSPFPKIEEINVSRTLFSAVPLEYNDQIRLVNAGRELSETTTAYEAGTITFTRKPAAQISSYEFSIDGMAKQSGDPLTDILGYQPDGDFVKRKRALDSLSKLEFSKRKPYLLFTLENPGGGVAVCWGKMRDASGYVISRRDVFYGVDLPDIALRNDDLVTSTRALLADERFFQALSFYDWTTAQDVFAFVDDTLARDTLYSYRVSALQKKAPASPFIFDVPMNALLFSPTLVKSTNDALEREAKVFGRDPTTMSPYPAIAQAVYGDPSYGWIIAGCNILASRRRGDSDDAVRANSYIGSSVDRLLAEVQAGRVFIPSDIRKVQETVENAVSSYGISQTILSVLDGTGVTHFISGKDDPNGIQATQQSVEGSTTGLARILSVIDPETATLDPKLIVIGGQANSLRNSSVPVRDSSDGVKTFDEIIDEGVIDLTVYAGVSRFMQLLRTVYDFYPGTFV
jgi:hypothetical protein